MEGRREEEVGGKGEEQIELIQCGTDKMKSTEVQTLGTI